jgi:hypothetical protein
MSKSLRRLTTAQSILYDQQTSANLVGGPAAAQNLIRPSATDYSVGHQIVTVCTISLGDRPFGWNLLSQSGYLYRCD